MNKSAIAIAAGVAAIVLVWVVIFLSSSDDQPAVEHTPIETSESAIEEQVAEANVEPPPEPSAAPTPPAAAPPSPQRIPSDQLPPDYQSRPEKIGPVAELKAAYQSEPRDPEAGATEERIRGHLKQEDIPPQLVRSVSCVKSVCKLEMNWTSDERHGYMIAMMTLISHIGQQVAADPVGNDDGQAVHPIDVYVSRIVPPYTPAPAGQ
jgi:hypothetical protein